MVQQQVHCESGLVEDLKYINLSGRKPCQGMDVNVISGLRAVVREMDGGLDQHPTIKP